MRGIATLCALLVVAAAASCGGEGGVDGGGGSECSGEDACSTIAGVTYLSVEQLGCPGGTFCNWRLTFLVDGEYSWQYTDVIEHGSYRCDCSLVHGQSSQGERDGEYDAQSGVLTWDGRSYQAE